MYSHLTVSALLHLRSCVSSLLGVSKLTTLIKLNYQTSSKYCHRSFVPGLSILASCNYLPESTSQIFSL